MVRIGLARALVVLALVASDRTSADKVLARRHIAKALVNMLTHDGADMVRLADTEGVAWALAELSSDEDEECMEVGTAFSACLPASRAS